MEDNPLKKFISTEEAQNLVEVASINGDWIDTEEAQKVSSIEEIGLRQKYMQEIIDRVKLRREFFEESPIIFKQAVNLKDVPEWIYINVDCQNWMQMP